MCLFCQLIADENLSSKVYQDENVVGFKDINPMAKIHLLFVHKTHTDNINDLMDAAPAQVVDIYAAIKNYTRQVGMDKTGFRVVTNMGDFAGQTVFHTHFHVLGGEPLKDFGA